METSPNNEAAELLAMVRDQQVRTRRQVGVAWLAAAFGGAAMLVAAAANASPLAPWINAVLTGAIMFAAGALASRIVRRSEQRFGFELELRPYLLAALVLGLAVGTAWVALRNDADPVGGARLIGASCAIALNGLILLVIPPRRPAFRFWGWALLATGVVMALATALAPHSYVARDLIFAAALLLYAAVAWARAGRPR
jgi:hypothetical protein